MPRSVNVYTTEYISTLILPTDIIEGIMESIEENADCIHDDDFPSILVIIDSKVIDLKGFLTTHPGGPMAILQFVGKDATAAFNSLHSGRAKQLLSNYIVGSISE